jgi:hypothetical protein
MFDGHIQDDWAHGAPEADIGLGAVHDDRGDQPPTREDLLDGHRPEVGRRPGGVGELGYPSRASRGGPAGPSAPWPPPRARGGRLALNAGDSRRGRAVDRGRARRDPRRRRGPGAGREQEARDAGCQHHTPGAAPGTVCAAQQATAGTRRVQATRVARVRGSVGCDAWASRRAARDAPGPGHGLCASGGEPPPGAWGELGPRSGPRLGTRRSSRGTNAGQHRGGTQPHR